MQKPSRTSAAAIALAVVGLIAAGSMVVASDASPDKAGNATTLNGYAAKDLTKSQYTRNPESMDDFDSCTPRSVLKQTFKAPRAGYLQVSGGAGAARDADFPDVAELTIWLQVKQREISGLHATQLTSTGSVDGNVAVDGYTKVKKGKTTIKLMMTECGNGNTAAFVTDRTISTSFSPFGSSKIVGGAPAKQPSNGQGR